MIVKRFPVNPFEMNCYVYHDENSKEGVIIDPGAYTNEERKIILDYITSNSIKIKYILLTHGHVDHILGNKWAKENFHVDMFMHKEDLPLIERSTEQALMFGVEIEQSPHPDKFLDENSELNVGDCRFKIIHTPGHSPGSICYIDEKNKLIFGGDCLFKGSIGRTDLWRGNYDELLASIKNKILIYPDEFTVYSGHFEETTIGDEKKLNPFLKEVE